MCAALTVPNPCSKLEVRWGELCDEGDPEAMARYAFGADAVDVSGEPEGCQAIGCQSQSVLVSEALPLCEAHTIQAYREIGEFLRAKESVAVVDTNAAFYRKLETYEPIKIPFGRCPACGLLGLWRHRETGAVHCPRRDTCGYAVLADGFDALCKERIAQASVSQEVVYYVRFGDRVKIGTTKDLDSRLLSIPHDELLATEPGGVYVEKQRHRQFQHLRAKVGNSREWFSLTPELADHIAAIRRRAELASA